MSTRNELARVRPERPGDAPAVRRVNEQAFGRATEADLVDALRDRGKGTAVLGLGPMAVLPAHQRAGIGSLLVRAGIEECRRAGHRGVVVLGHPEYYPRFGFVPASRHGLAWEHPVPDEAFMVLDSATAPCPGRGASCGISPSSAESEGASAPVRSADRRMAAVPVGATLVRARRGEDGALAPRAPHELKARR